MFPLQLFQYVLNVDTVRLRLASICTEWCYHNPSHGSVSRDSPRVSCHVTSLSGRPVLLLGPVDVDCVILPASTAVAVTVLDKKASKVMVVRQT